MIENAIRAKLVATSGVNNLVSGRVYFGVCPQDADLPNIVLTIIDKQHPHTHGGSAGYTQGRMQIDCAAATYKGAKDLVAAVIAAIDDLTGDIGDGVVGSENRTFSVDYVEVESERDMMQATPEGDAVPSYYVVSVDAMFQH